MIARDKLMKKVTTEQEHWAVSSTLFSCKMIERDLTFSLPGLYIFHLHSNIIHINYNYLPQVSSPSRETC